MNEDLYCGAYHQLCEHLRAIRKSREWEHDYVTFEDYTKRRWGLSKARTKLLLNFVAFVDMCRESRLPLPDSPECVQPILSTSRKSWTDVWRLCVDCGKPPMTLGHVKATMERFGIITHKKPPPEVLDTMRAKAGARALASIGNVENVKTVGQDWDKGIYNMIEIDQRRQR